MLSARRAARAHKVPHRAALLTPHLSPPLNHPPTKNKTKKVGDWLQGPYVYALYESYGYSPAAIGQLFIAGFGSSLVFGTVVGALSDRLGRRNASLLYVLTYSLSCVTKHSPDFKVLMLGRILGGIATSLLFSAFEAWLVAEHFKRGYGEASLGDTFAWAIFLGNGLMAIVAGFAGNYLVENLGLGRVAPFDAAIVAMLIGGLVMARTWTENYGDRSSKGLGEQFEKAWAAIAGGESLVVVFAERRGGEERERDKAKTRARSLNPQKPTQKRAAANAPRKKRPKTDPCVALLGVMQAVFEAAMYSFVFLWTMALSPNKESIQHGLVFVNMMTACMVGSFLSSILMKRQRPEKYMPAVFACAALALAVPAVADFVRKPDPSLAGKPITPAGVVQLLAFCAFEVCVGVFWPSMMKLRSGYVPEEQRATIINVFRIPLNAFVCIVLYNVEAFPVWGMFGLCSVLMCVALGCMLKLTALVAAGAGGGFKAGEGQEAAGGGGGGAGAAGHHHAHVGGGVAAAAFEKLPTSEGEVLEMSK